MRRIDAAWTALLTVVILGPLLTGWGFWLFGDMVFVPEQPWKDAWLGLDGTLPRAVPMDAIVSVLTQVLPGELVQRLLLVGAFLAGGIGAGLFVRGHGTAARLAAITLMLWNPWVYERLLMGQWAILAGYLLLPWVALASLRMRRDLRRGAPAVAVALVLSAVCSPSSGVMAALVVVVLGLRRSLPHVAVTAGLIIVANLSWLLPSLLADANSDASSEVFDAFAARGESSLGTLPSLFSLGGTWKTSIVPEERTSVVIVLLSCALTAVALLGLLRRPRPRLLVLAGISFFLAALPVLPGGDRLLEAVGDVVPATALLRDSHRFLAPAILALLPGIAGAVDWSRAQVRPEREAMWSVVGLLVVAPILLLPSLAWGSLGELQPSEYPDEWRAVADHLDDHGPGRSVVLPWAGSYRGLRLERPPRGARPGAQVPARRGADRRPAVRGRHHHPVGGPVGRRSGRRSGGGGSRIGTARAGRPVGRGREGNALGGSAGRRDGIRRRPPDPGGPRRGGALGTSAIRLNHADTGRSHPRHGDVTRAVFFC